MQKEVALMKRIISVLAVAALMAVMLVAMAAPAFAEPSIPADCHGKLNQFGNQFGLSPSDAMKNPVPIVNQEGEFVDYETAGEWNKALQEGSAGYEVGPFFISCFDV